MSAGSSDAGAAGSEGRLIFPVGLAKPAAVAAAGTHAWAHMGLLSQQLEAASKKPMGPAAITKPMFDPGSYDALKEALRVGRTLDALHASRSSSRTRSHRLADLLGPPSAPEPAAAEGATPMSLPSSEQPEWLPSAPAAQAPPVSLPEPLWPFGAAATAAAMPAGAAAAGAGSPSLAQHQQPKPWAVQHKHPKLVLQPHPPLKLPGSHAQRWRAQQEHSQLLQEHGAFAFCLPLDQLEELEAQRKKSRLEEVSGMQACALPRKALPS